MIIAIDNGHGLQTPGKRTPVFPDGTQVREWQFNFATAQKLGALLKKRGIQVLFVSPTEADRSLAERAQTANRAQAALFLSIHYNAKDGQWGEHGGVETYYYTGSVQGEALARPIQQFLIQKTGRRDRGVKSGNFYVLRETTMPAVLVECGFMDNLEEAKDMLNETFQQKCAEALFEGLCQYLSLPTLGDIEGIEGAEEVAIPLSHWAEPFYQRLTEKGLEILEKRYDETITRGEVMVLLDRLTDWVKTNGD